MNNVTIDKNIPIPPSSRGNPKYPWQLMEINDSFFVPGKNVCKSLGTLNKSGKKDLFLVL